MALVFIYNIRHRWQIGIYINQGSPEKASQWDAYTERDLLLRVGSSGLIGWQIQNLQVRLAGWKPSWTSISVCIRRLIAIEPERVDVLDEVQRQCTREFSLDSGKGRPFLLFKLYLIEWGPSTLHETIWYTQISSV
jgi:hypothetical protein